MTVLEGDDLATAIEADATALSPFKKGALAERRRDVFAKLAASGLALTRVECDPDLLGHGGGIKHEATPEAKYLTALISEDAAGRRKALKRLPLLDKKLVKPIREPLFLAVLALIEAELRSPAIPAFLLKQNYWPADFVDGLRAFAVDSGPSERAYVVDLLRHTGKLNRDWLKTKFYLGANVDAGLARIISTNGRSLCGE